MWKLSDLIGDYEEPNLIKGSNTNKEYPIPLPKESGWVLKENPERLVKIYKLSLEEKFNAFIIDLLEHQAETQHHGRITMQFPQIKIEVWTHDLNDVTEIDLEWAKVVNNIFEGYDE